MVTHNRDERLIQTLNEMDGLKGLRCIVVFWNDVTRDPPSNITWPKIHVPIYYVNATRNSLNNRFLPMDLIETEAVFSMDDDFNVNRDDILFAFR